MNQRLITSIILLLMLTPVQAYIGPGAGIPVLGSLIGLLVTVIVVIGAILFWPIRKIMKKRKQKTDSDS